MGWMPSVAVTVQESGQEIEFPVERAFNGGYAGRDQESVWKHVEELAEIGVPAPTRVPTLYALGNNLVTTAGTVQVQHDRTSGEVEYVLLMGDGEVFVTVGSDHTDRDLETSSVERSKQAYPNILAPEAWRYEEVAGHWDQLVLRCWVTRDGVRELYQEATLAALLQPDFWFETMEELLGGRPRNVVFMSGTIPAMTGIVYADAYEMELHDPVRGRSIRHSYNVEILREKIV
jgi:hypothetical protein